jgi:hypothetical protein
MLLHWITLLDKNLEYLATHFTIFYNNFSVSRNTRTFPMKKKIAGNITFWYNHSKLIPLSGSLVGWGAML